MEFLKSFLLRAFTFIFILSACSDGAVVQTIPIELDTYIDSTLLVDQSSSLALKVGKNGNAEQRALMKIPSGNEDKALKNAWLDGEIDNPLEVILLPYYITSAVMYALLGILTTDPDAETIELTSTNLNSSKLKIYLDSVEAAAAASGKIRVQLVNRAWFPTCTWTQAHSFSKNGAWTSVGADVDTTLSVLGTQSDVASAVIEFDIKSYMSTLIDESTTTAHFGFLLSAEEDGTTFEINSSNASAGNPTVTSVYTSGGSVYTGIYTLKSHNPDLASPK